jgi:sensor c-di-GMP phosphodiesterase-like protein
MGQGYLFAKPMAMNDWLSWMEARRPTSSEPSGAAQERSSS